MEIPIQERIRQYTIEIVEAMITGVERERAGCYLYFAVAPSRFGLLSAVPLVDELFLAQGRMAPEGKPDGWKVNAKEKPLRTALVQTAFSSFQAGHDPANKKYGGGIVFEHQGVWYAIGVSGFSEIGDEAVCLLLALLLGILDVEMAQLIAAGNGESVEVLRSLIAALSWGSRTQGSVLDNFLDSLNLRA